MDNNHHPPPLLLLLLPSPISFLSLPAEIRTHIYQDLFRNTSLTISPYPPRLNPNDHTVPRPEDGFYYSGLSEPVSGILSTCHQIRAETLPISSHCVFQSLIITPPISPTTRLPHAFRLGEGIEMPSCHDFHYIMRRRILRVSTPWLDGLQGRDGRYLEKFMPNLRSIEIIARAELLDMSTSMARGGLLQKFFSCVNAGSGVIASEMPLAAIRIMRSAENVIDRVRLRVWVMVVCEERVPGEDPDEFLHGVLLECVVNPKTFEVVHYRRLRGDEGGKRVVNGYAVTMVPAELCRCDLDKFAKSHVTDTAVS